MKKYKNNYKEANVHQDNSRIGAYLFVLFLALVPFGAFAPKAHANIEINKAIEFEFNTKEKIIAPLGSKSQTRIDIIPYTIKEIVGDSTKYTALYDSKARHLFLLPKVESGEKIELSLVTTSGKVQDFTFIVTGDEGKTILVTQNNTLKVDTVQCLEKEAKLMLLSMIKGEKGKYYLKDLTSSNNHTNDNCSSCKNSQNSRGIKGMVISNKKYPVIKQLDNFEILESKVYS